jgi:hypothetical protein
VQVGIDLL